MKKIIKKPVKVKKVKPVDKVDEELGEATNVVASSLNETIKAFEVPKEVEKVAELSMTTGREDLNLIIAKLNEVIRALK